MFKHRLIPEFPIRSGVTLVELILVLAISSFMIVLALGGVNNRGRSQFDQGMDQVLSSLRQAQNEATNGQGLKCTTGTPGCLASGQEIFGRGMSFKVGVDSYKIFLVNSWGNPGDENSAVQQGIVPEENKRFPVNVTLKSITQKLPESTINVQTPAMIDGLLVFARGGTGSGGGVSNVALPYFFNQGSVNDPVSSRLGQIGATGFTAAQSVSTYDSPRNNVVTLTFENPDNANMKAKIVINSASGTMELVK